MNTGSKNRPDEAALVAMVARHPADRELIEETFARDSRFRDLCDEYLTCLRALEVTQPAPELRELETALAEEARLWMLVIRAQKRRRQS
jgi:hypothetical protein